MNDAVLAEAVDSDAAGVDTDDSFLVKATCMDVTDIGVAVVMDAAEAFSAEADSYFSFFPMLILYLA